MDIYPASRTLSLAVTLAAAIVLASPGAAAQSRVQPSVPQADTLPCLPEEYPQGSPDWESADGAQTNRGPLRASRTSTGRTAIVLVHGYQPWIQNCGEFGKVGSTKSGEGHFANLWPILDNEFGDKSRIMAFTYPTFNVFEVSGGQLAKLVDAEIAANRIDRVIFIGHSMGGLVARWAAYELTTIYRRPPSLVVAVLTLGTPHRGISRIDQGIGTLFLSGPQSPGGTEGAQSLRGGWRLQGGTEPSLHAFGGWLPFCLGTSVDGSRNGLFLSLVYVYNCAFLWAKSAVSDGLVELTSAVPDYAQVPHVLLGYDHSEMAAGNNLRGSSADPLFQQIVEDLRQVTSLPPVVTLQVSSGNNQAGVAGSILPTAVSVLASNQAGRAVGLVPVTFRITSGGGCVSESPAGTNCQSELARITNGTSGSFPGVAGVFWKLGALAGTQTLEVVSPGLASLAFTATSSPAALPAVFSFTDLGELPGGDGSSEALAVNVHGTVVGSSSTRSDNEYTGCGSSKASAPFIWTASTGMQALAGPTPVLDIGSGPTKPCFGRASGVNDLGVVVGSLSYGLFAGGERPFVWTLNGGMRLIDTPTMGAARAINNAGQVAGNDTNGVFRWTEAGGFDPLPRSIGVSVGNSINERGEVAGFVFISGCAASATVWSASGPIQQFLDMPEIQPTLPPGDFLCQTRADAINGAGDVVGWFGIRTSGNISPGSMSAFAWFSDTSLAEPVGSLPQNPSRIGTEAKDINNNRWVVGISEGRAFRWTRDTAIRDLNLEVDESGLGWTLVSGNAVNDFGQIVGDGASNGVSRAFLLTPKPGSNVEALTRKR